MMLRPMMPDIASAPDEDADLLLAYAQGDGAAAGVLTARLAPRLLRYAARLLGDRTEAEDVTQEAMLRLWRIAPDWRTGEAQVRTWAYRVTANLCTDRLRHRRARPNVALDQVADPPDPTRSAEAGMIAADRAAALNTALLALPDRQRQAVVLRHLEGLSNPEIAEILDTGVEAVESLIARGKRGLTALLSGQSAALGYDDD